MKHHLAAALLLGSLCSASCYEPDGGYASPSTGFHDRGFCEQFTSCGTCTPVLGCGWCQSGSKGLCAPDPDRCDQAASFSWTWELDFCPAEPDGGVDAADAARTDAARADAADAD
jgi:hypothetical protein